MNRPLSDCKVLPCGDCAVSVDFGSIISPEVNSRVQNLRALLSGISGITETVPAFRSLTVLYDPCVLSFEEICQLIKKVLTVSNTQNNVGNTNKKVFHIPVCYGGDYGEDIADVCSLTGLSENEIVLRHSSPEYLIYMLGFLPGFAYLGGLDKAIAVPRLPSPRTLIPTGSVGIGGEQTGIYPIASPGGWRLIGRTPVLPYDPDRDPVILYEAGDYIKFEPVTHSEFEALTEDIRNGTFSCEVHKYER